MEIVKLQGNEYENERRIFWPSGDPALIAEAFYCIGVILAYARMLYLFQISQVNLKFRFVLNIGPR